MVIFVKLNFCNKAAGGLGSGQANIPIFHFIHSKTIGFFLLYRSFWYRKKPYTATWTPEVRSLLANTTTGSNALCPTILPFAFFDCWIPAYSHCSQRWRSLANFNKKSLLWHRWVIYPVKPFLTLFNWGMPYMPRNVMTFRSCQTASPYFRYFRDKKAIIALFYTLFLRISQLLSDT